MIRLLRLVALAGTLAAALSLALLRVYVEPIFGPSDEDDHFDYAISIARAGHLLSAKNPLGSPAADLETEFLQTYSDRPRIYLNPGERVAPGYGTHQYFRRIDVRSRAELPDAHRWMNARDHRNPVLVSMYPFGFYSLDALAIAAASQLRGSLSDAFFGARLLSVALLALTLAFAYGVARQLGMARPYSTAFVAVVGCFALTTFVASYVQPDNLAAAATTATFYYSLRLRASSALVDRLALAFALGVLTLTKYQTALCVALAVVPMLAVTFASRTRSWPRALAAAAVVLVPAALGLAVQALVVGRNAAFAASVGSHFRAFTSLANLPAELAQFALRCAQGAWYLFIGNVSEPMTHDYRVAAALSYWNDFGNLDTPVTLLTPAFDRIARAAIAILTGAIVLSTLAGFGLVAVRLGRLARRGRGLAALRLATANTPLNAYFIFCAFMIVFYALTGNNWRTSGRNFFPFIVPALLLGVRYAPRVLPRPHWRRAFGGTVFALLALYSSVGSYDAAAAVVHRYYGPPDLPPLASYRRASGAALAFDRVGSPPVESAQAVSDGRPRVRATVQGDVLLIDGLAADIATRGAAGGVIAVLDGTKQYAAAYGFAHADLAERFHDPRLFWAGYRFEIPTANVALGPHRLRFYVVSHDRRRASEARASVNADVVPLAEAAASPEGERDTVDPPQDPLPALRGERRVFAASVDQVSPLGDARYWAQGPAWIRRGEYVFVKGWGLDFVHHRNLAPVDVVVDGSARFAAHLGDVRPDVMLGYSNLPVAATQGAGWSVAIPTAALRFGEHELCVTSVDPRSGRPLVLAGRVPFTIF